MHRIWPILGPLIWSWLVGSPAFCSIHALSCWSIVGALASSGRVLHFGSYPGVVRCTLRCWGGSWPRSLQARWIIGSCYNYEEFSIHEYDRVYLYQGGYRCHLWCVLGSLISLHIGYTFPIWDIGEPATVGRGPTLDTIHVPLLS